MSRNMIIIIFNITSLLRESVNALSFSLFIYRKLLIVLSLRVRDRYK